MNITRQLSDSKGRLMNLYVCSDGIEEFIFKEVHELAIYYELLVQKLAPCLQVRTLPFLQKISIGVKNSLLMSFVHNSQLLCDYNQELTAVQKKELQRILLMDILIGNKDRHAANIFVNKHLTAFDHDKLFMGKERKSSAFIKIDVGLKLDGQYVAKMEQIIKRGNVSTATALQVYFEFEREDILNIKSLSDTELDFVLDSSPLERGKKSLILEFLKYRRDNFDSLPYA